jgi:hypothetical protein
VESPARSTRNHRGAWCAHRPPPPAPWLASCASCLPALTRVISRRRRRRRDRMWRRRCSTWSHGEATTCSLPESDPWLSWSNRPPSTPVAISGDAALPLDLAPMRTHIAANGACPDFAYQPVRVFHLTYIKVPTSTNLPQFRMH